GLLLGVAVAGGTAAVLFFGVRHVQSGLISLGDLVLVMFYLAMLYHPLETIGNKVAAVQNALASADRAYRLLAEKPDVFERPNARPLSRSKGAVEFRSVSFSYDGGPPILQVSFDAPAGARVGIAGETGVGVRGMRLSGGQRQLVSVARAYLRDAPILILDEPTSSIDRETEGALLDALHRLVRGRTSFIVSHRQSTLESCDRLLILRRGERVSWEWDVRQASGEVVSAPGA